MLQCHNDNRLFDASCVGQPLLKLTFEIAPVCKQAKKRVARCIHTCIFIAAGNIRQVYSRGRGSSRTSLSSQQVSI